MVFSYSYYLYHPREWSSICSGQDNWEGRAIVFDWHIQFSPCFKEYNKVFGIKLILDDLYSDLSCFIHGIPAKGLPSMQSLDRTELNKTEVTPVIDLADRLDYSLNLLLIGIFYKLLPVLGHAEYKLILSGIDKTKLSSCGITLPAL